MNTKVKCGKNTWAVSCVPFETLKDTIEEAENAWGITRFKTQEMFIASDLNKDIRVRTFYHELVHALFAETGITELLNAALSDGLAESLCTVLGDQIATTDWVKIKDIERGIREWKEK